MEQVVFPVALEGRVQIHEVYRAVVDVLPEHVEVVAVVQRARSLLLRLRSPNFFPMLAKPL